MGAVRHSGRRGERTFTHNGQPMGLDNGGETAELVNGAGQVVDSVTYSGAQEGQLLDADGVR